jgi:hypothetical protein
MKATPLALARLGPLVVITLCKPQASSRLDASTGETRDAIPCRRPRRPGFATAAEALTVLETEILPGFDAMIELEAEKKILAGGLPVGDCAFVFIIEAADDDAGW